MGTWSNKPFGNDTASDWVLKLLAEPGDGLIHEALSIDTGKADAAQSECAVAAAAVVAAAASESLQGISRELKAWIRQRGYAPDKDAVRSAISAVDSITDKSELRDLWEEEDALDGWLRVTTDVRERLQAALESGLATRSPRKAGMPRNLGKLVERYTSDREPKVLDKIREKLHALSDPNKATRQSGFRKPIVLLAEAGLVSEMQLLIERGVDVTDPDLISRDSPLNAACKGDRLAAVEFLVAAGVPVVEEELRDRQSGSEKWLYDQDPEGWHDAWEHEPEWYTYRYSQPLWHAIRCGSIDMIEYLLSAGADIDQQDLNGETLLHKAAHAGRCDVMAFLVAKGFDVNADSPDLEAPIFHAVRGGNVEAVQWLAELGADVNALSWLGGAPLDLTENNPEIAAVLSEHGARSRASERRNGAETPSVQRR